MEKYRNITISGLSGTGTTTLLRLLQEQLAGWEGFSGGEFMRAYALEQKLFKPNEGMHHDARHYDEDFDRKVDYGMREALRNKGHQVMEAWLSGFMAQGVEGVLKVLLVCDESLRIDRMANRDNLTIAEAKANAIERKKVNLEKWSRMYAKEWKEWVVDRGTMETAQQIDFWDPKLYDVIIDTYSHSKEETLALVLKALNDETG
jgi:cytidylate kinase